MKSRDNRSITISKRDIERQLRKPLPKQTEKVMKDRRKKRPDRGLPKSQKHKLEE